MAVRHKFITFKAMWIVTGATGFIGSALIWELNQMGLRDILAVDHISPDERPSILQKRQYAGFVKAWDLFKAVEGKKIDGVLHMGACSTTTETDEEYLRKNNIEYSQKIFELCTKAKAPLVYASSAATYGDGTKGFDDASDSKQFKPLNLYGWSKLKFDIWALEQKQSPPHWYGLKFFNVYGPNEYHKGEQASVAFKAYNQIREKGALRLFKSHNPEYADGEQLRDFIYIKDITRWIRELIEKKEVRSGLYNMGTGQARSWLDLAKNAFKAADKPLNVEWMEVPPNIRNQYQYFTEAKMDRLFAEGLSKPAWSLERGVDDYLRGYLAKEDRYL